MREAVIVASVRTASRKSFAARSTQPPGHIAAPCVREVLRRVPQQDPTEVDDVILGTASRKGRRGCNVGRTRRAHGRLPPTVSGSTVSRFCACGPQRDRDRRRMIEGGSYGRRDRRRSRVHHHAAERLQPQEPSRTPGSSSTRRTSTCRWDQTAEVVAERYGITRERRTSSLSAHSSGPPRPSARGKFNDEILL